MVDSNNKSGMYLMHTALGESKTLKFNFLIKVRSSKAKSAPPPFGYCCEFCTHAM